MSADVLYTTQLGAGLGMISETIDLLRLWQPGMTSARLSDEVIREGLFSRATARRARNLVAEMFSPRFLKHDGQAASCLKFLQEHRFPHEALVQLLFIYTARAQRILADFVIEVFWSKYSSGATMVTKDESERFIQRSMDLGRMEKRWSSSMVDRVSGYLLGCCGDFGLLQKGGRSEHKIQRLSMRPEVAIYLAHELHFSGLSDMALIQSRDWLLFGFEPGNSSRG